jgi:ParB-like nuclease domain
MLSHTTTGMPSVDARDDFQRARRAQVAARTARWLGRGRRRPNTPRTLCDAAALPRAAARLSVIPLSEVVGTVEPTITFDARFRPASELVRARWERIALAHRRGVALPPIAVIEGPDGYYVVDGRHRVSVALALGHRDIEAWVTPTRSLPVPCEARAAA